MVQTGRYVCGADREVCGTHKEVCLCCIQGSRQQLQTERPGVKQMKGSKPSEQQLKLSPLSLAGPLGARARGTGRRVH